MARIKSPTNDLTPQEEIFAREVAYMMLGNDLKRIGIDIRYEQYLYLAYKKAYPRTKASVASLQVMASRLYKKVKIRLRVEELTRQFNESIVETTAEGVKQKFDRLLALGPADFHIIDPETGVLRKRKEYELSTDAWWCVKRLNKYGYEKMTLTEIVDALAKFQGWYKAQDINHHIEGDVSADDIVLTFGGKKYKSQEQ